MSTSDALVVGEAWISEHFFASDARNQSFLATVLERRKAWDAEEKEGRETPRSRFRTARRDLEVQLAELTETTDAATRAERTEKAHEVLVDVLGLRRSRHVVEDGPLLSISTPGMTDAAPLVVVRAAPVETVEELLAKDGDTLLAPHQLEEDGDPLGSAARLVSALFVSAEAPRFVLVLAGRWAVLAEQERWAEGRYLAVDVQLVCERNDTKAGGEVERALTCLAGESVGPDADGAVWWTGVLEESVKHTVGVSKDLREGVRLSIEIIANEVVRRRAADGLEPLPQSEAQPLAKQSLRYLYRILFLLYAEASPELGVLPVGAPEYAQGYSLDRLRELVQVTLNEDRAKRGRHLYESLGVLFRVVDQGAGTPPPADGPYEDGDDGRLTFQPLRADLFHPEAVAHIDEVGLGNAALQQVLGHLLLSKESRGRDRGYISYAELGINQLGAVYEGLMSYTGFFAEEDLYEVAKGGDASKGSWVVPFERAEGLSADDFVKQPDPQTHEMQPVVHRKGTFVFRLSGRDRQQSASYYTPEVLTRFTVGQALEELLDQGGETTSAADVLGLSVCEPALGSGAFAIEAVRQLAEQYLTRRQKELGERIDPDDYPRRLQEVKAYLALHNVYGVDLNATAVELAEISLWLDTMVEGLDAPWFGLHLRRGNSLIGARRAVFRRDSVKDGTWHTVVPDDVPLSSLADDMAAGRVGTDVTGKVHHFLLPAEGWGSAVDAKEAKALAPEAVDRLKTWRKGLKRKPTTAQVNALVDLSTRVEVLWQIALRRLQVAEQEIRRAIPVWGADDLPSGGAVQREQIEAALADASGAYQRLRRVMDAWCALWFWPLTDTLTTRTAEDGTVTRIAPPSLDQWIHALQMLLGTPGKADTKRHVVGQLDLVGDASWDELDAHEPLELSFAGASSIDAVTTKHPWLEVCEAVAAEQGFFHWDLDFASVFVRGGFDLQYGNPPWVQPEYSRAGVMAEFDPSAILAPNDHGEQVQSALMDRGLVGEAARVASTLAYLKNVLNYPYLGSTTADLYKSFVELSWRHGSTTGVSAFVHSSMLYQEERSASLRRASYRRLRRLWHYTNERKLFSEIGNRVGFVVSVHSRGERPPDFINACYLLEPGTALASLHHDGSGVAPNIKASDGTWDVRPHRGRIRQLNEQLLDSWSSGETDGAHSAPLVFAVNRLVDEVMGSLIKSCPPLSSITAMNHWYGYGETTGVDEGLLKDAWARVSNASRVILQGPHLSVCDPVFQERGVARKSHRDWLPVNHEQLPAAAEWCTGYQIERSVEESFGVPHWEGRQATDLYRLAWRRRVGSAGVRSLQPAIIPPGVRHIETVVSAGNPHWTPEELAYLCGALSSLLLDFQVRVAQKVDIRMGVIRRLRLRRAGQMADAIALRVMRLNCVNDSYAQLWRDWQLGRRSPSTRSLEWTMTPPPRVRSSDARLELDDVDWSPMVPLRSPWARRKALLEVDALIACSFEVSIERLIAVYDAQFGVLRGSEQGLAFDEHGRDVMILDVPIGARARLDVPARDVEMSVAYDHFSAMRSSRHD